MVADPEDGFGPPVPPTVMDEFDSVVSIPEAIARPVNASRTSLLHHVDGEFVWMETLSLAEFKIQHEGAITRAKIAANGDHFVFLGKRIEMDDSSFKEMQSICSWVAMTQTMPTNWPGGWKAMGDEGYVQFNTVPQWINFYGTMVQTGLANYMKSQILKAHIANATTFEEVAAITWSD
jgi:hypothetical protein